MKLLGLVGAVLGGTIGAAIWGLGAGGPTGFESTWTAILLGALVGTGCVLFGGRGLAMALCAGGISVAFMFAGKAFAAWIVLNREWGYSDRLAIAAAHERAHPFDQKRYDDLIVAAYAYGRVAGPNDYPQFIVDRGFEFDPPNGVASEAELARFETIWAPMLQRWSRERPQFKKARDEYLDAYVRDFELEYKSTKTTTDLFLDTRLDLFDFLFGVLGLITPIGIVETVTESARMRREAEERKARQMAERKPLPRMSPTKPNVG